MSYRKISADKIFDGYRFRQDHVLVVRENGSIEALLPETEAGGDIQVMKGVLSPGLINCHCHLELSHMKGRIPERTGLVDFVFKVVTERHYSDDEILDAIEKGENEMYGNGIVAVGDICNNPLTIAQKMKARLQYYNFIETSGWLPAVAQQRFERAKQLAGQFSVLHSPFSLSPHAPYSVSNELWHYLQPHFSQKVVTIHNQESKAENEFFLEATGDFLRMYGLMKMDNSHHRPSGRSSLRSYYENLSGAARVLLVHNTFTSREDIDYVSSRNQLPSPSVFFCLCVNANQYIENTLPPLTSLREARSSIVLGTDSLASNHTLNILDEIRTIRSHFPSVPFEEMLQWATINGAQALDMDKKLGSFEPGKIPGVILINETDLTVERMI